MKTLVILSTIIGIAIGVGSACAAPTPHVTATWGGDYVKLIEIKTGKTWLESYDDFFAKCGKHKPSELGVKVMGRLPSWYKGRGSQPPKTRGLKPAPPEEPVVAPLIESGSNPVNPLLPDIAPKTIGLLDAFKSMITGAEPEFTMGEDQRQRIVPETEGYTLIPGMEKPAARTRGLKKEPEPSISDRVVATIDGVKVYSLLTEDPAPSTEPARKSGVIAGNAVTITPTYDVRYPAVVTPYALDALFKGELAGMGEVFIREAKKNNICPLFLAGVAMHESDSGKSYLCRNNKNAFGSYDSKHKVYRSFPNIEASIAFTASQLNSSLYVLNKKKMCHTIRQIHDVYCPIGAGNDPKKVNKFWSSGVVYHMQRFLGPTVYVASN